LEYIFGAYRKVRPFFLKTNYMKKISTYILLIMAIFVVSARDIRAQEVSVSRSAVLKDAQKPQTFDYRVENLRNFLIQFNSPLAPYAQDFVTFADANGLDYRLVPSISGVESTFGKAIPSNSFNAYGWANGNYSFSSWSDSISVVSQTLRTEYIEKGANSLNKIARRYAPPSSTWGSKVKYFEGKIDTLPLSFDI